MARVNGRVEFLQLTLPALHTGLSVYVIAASDFQDLFLVQFSKKNAVDGSVLILPNQLRLQVPAIQPELFK